MCDDNYLDKRWVMVGSAQCYRIIMMFIKLRVHILFFSSKLPISHPIPSRLQYMTYMRYLDTNTRRAIKCTIIIIVEQFTRITRNAICNTHAHTAMSIIFCIITMRTPAICYFPRPKCLVWYLLWKYYCYIYSCCGRRRSGCGSWHQVHVLFIFFHFVHV